MDKINKKNNQISMDSSEVEVPERFVKEVLDVEDLTPEEREMYIAIYKAIVQDMRNGMTNDEVILAFYRGMVEKYGYDKPNKQSKDNEID